MVVNLQISLPVISQLAALGWLSEQQGDDKSTLTRALTEFVYQALRLRVTPHAGACGGVIFLAEIPASTIERLVPHGWIERDHQRDSGAIATAYCRFAGGSIGVA